ncbi:MAG: hypothetical protein K5673_08310 [Lachnospiraceae bacterium]|nr:hypothetical protein [Lachnospiraceae bacterium]
MPLAFLIVLFCIMILPGVYRGCNYYAYKGNVYDKYAYLSETAYMATHEATYGDYEMVQEEYYPDAFDLGYYYIVNDRPATSLVCAEIACGGDLFFAGYLFVTFIWAIISGPMIALIRKLFPNGHFISYLFFSLVYVFGVFSQLQNDMDTWSQQSSIAMFITFTFVWLSILKDVLYEEQTIGIRRLLGLGIFGTGFFMLYAEATWVYGLILVVVTLVMYAVMGAYHSKNKLMELLKMVLIPVQMLLYCYLAHPGTFMCNFMHILFATESSNQSWTGFYSYWKGYHEFIAAGHTGAVIKQLATIIPCWSGMYMITPVYTGIPIVVIGLWLLALTVLSLSIIVLFGYSICYAIKHIRVEMDYYKVTIILCSILSTAFFMLWIFTGQYFTAAKSLMFIAPFSFLLLAMPVMEFTLGDGSDVDSPKACRYIFIIVSSVFIITQLSALGLRISHIITDEDGVMGLGEYYPVCEADVKRGYLFDFNATDYADEEVVAIVGGNAFYQLYVKLCLAYEGVDYYTVGDFGAFKYTYSEGTELREGDTAIYLQDFEKP